MDLHKNIEGRLIITIWIVIAVLLSFCLGEKSLNFANGATSASITPQFQSVSPNLLELGNSKSKIADYKSNIIKQAEYNKLLSQFNPAALEAIPTKTQKLPQVRSLKHSHLSFSMIASVTTNSETKHKIPRYILWQ
jgi:hypothetical protein